MRALLISLIFATNLFAQIYGNHNHYGRGVGIVTDGGSVTISLPTTITGPVTFTDTTTFTGKVTNWAAQYWVNTDNDTISNTVAASYPQIRYKDDGGANWTLDVADESGLPTWASMNSTNAIAFQIANSLIADLSTATYKWQFREHFQVFDNKYIVLGNDADYRIRLNTTGNVLSIEDGSSNVMMSVTDNVTVGDVAITGAISKGSGTFRIDHPLKDGYWLQHSFVESPDMLNIYSGNVIADGYGRAFVKMPEYFKYINSDFRYQLTGWDAESKPYIEISLENTYGEWFTVSGIKPYGKISWYVTTVRSDEHAKKYPVEVEKKK